MNRKLIVLVIRAILEAQPLVDGCIEFLAEIRVVHYQYVQEKFYLMMGSIAKVSIKL